MWTRAGTVAVVMVMAAACGSGTTQPAAPKADGAIERPTGLRQLLVARGQPVAISAQLQGPVTLGGVWFADERCRADFGQPGPVAPARLPALATCIASLPLTESARDSVTQGLRLVAYEPGLELEVLFARDQPAQIRYIGFVSRVLAADAAPTITQAAFEARLTDRALADLRGEELWAKVCVDATGSVVSARVDRASAPAVVAPILAQLKQWRTEPFIVDGAPMPVCSVLRIATSPAGSDSYVPRVPEPGQGDALTVAVAALGKATAGTFQVGPSDADKNRMARAGVPATTATVRFCVGTDGHVKQAWTAFPSGLPDYDAKLVAAAKTWTYPARTEPVCAFLDFVYSQRVRGRRVP